MHHLPSLSGRQITLLIGPRAQREMMLELTAVLALRGHVRVIDGGNSFDPYHVARAIRRRTHRLDEIFDRVTIARAFTCYQVVTLLEHTPATDRPHLVCDLTATFYDEAVSYNESYRLLRIAAGELRRLSRRAPVVVTTRPAPHGERSGLLRLLEDTADHVLLPNGHQKEGSSLGKMVPLWETDPVT
ncbi:MAG: hypothetical protein ACK2U0_14875 [Candidatus Promineifilaceae bacterium]|jgi:hypothetical protein